MWRQRLVNSLDSHAVSKSALDQFRSWRMKRHLAVGPRETTFGFQFYGPMFMADGSYEPHETRVVSKLLETSASFLNVGANLGYYCCLAMHKGVRSVALEPDPGNAQYLLRNLAENGWTEDCQVFLGAAGEESGVAELYGSGMGASLDADWAGRHQPASLLVPRYRLDDLLNPTRFSHPLLILIDVEGAELSVLRGMDSYLDFAPAPIWIVEISLGEHPVVDENKERRCRATFDTFFSRGYECFVISDHLHPLSRNSLAIELTRARPFGPARNFLFSKDMRPLENLVSRSTRWPAEDAP